MGKKDKKGYKRIHHGNPVICRFYISVHQNQRDDCKQHGNKLCTRVLHGSLTFVNAPNVQIFQQRKFRGTWWVIFFNSISKFNFNFSIPKPFTVPCQIAIIQSNHLTTSNILWYSLAFFCRVSDRHKVERLQERALRIVFNSKLDFYENLLKQANLTTLNNRRLQDIAILMFKAKNKLLPKYLQDLFITQEVENRRCILRNSHLTMSPFKTVKYGKHSLKYLGPFLWSRLT